MWRSAALPRTAAVLFAVSGVLVAIPVPLHSVRLAGGVLGLTVGAWIAIAVRQQLQITVPVTDLP
jgi:hypothetical protein